MTGVLIRRGDQSRHRGMTTRRYGRDSHLHTLKNQPYGHLYFGLPASRTGAQSLQLKQSQSHPAPGVGEDQPGQRWVASCFHKCWEHSLLPPPLSPFEGPRWAAALPASWLLLGRKCNLFSKPRSLGAWESCTAASGINSPFSASMSYDG